jgi:hypothetical protein
MTPAPASGAIPERWRRRCCTPRDKPEPGLRIAFVADPDGNLVELLSSDEEAPPT